MRFTSQRITNSAVSRVIYANECEFFSTQEYLKNRRVERRDRLTLVNGHAVDPFFNGVFHNRRVAEGDVDEAVGYFQDTPFTWWLQDGVISQDSNLYLEERGFRHMKQNALMAVFLMSINDFAAPPDGLVIERVGNYNQFNEFMGVFQSSFDFAEDTLDEINRWFNALGLNHKLRHFVAYYDRQPVACASLFTGKHAAGIYNVATLPDYRGMGIGSAITLAALRLAGSLSYMMAVLQASTPGIGVYNRLGFKAYGTVRGMKYSA